MNDELIPIDLTDYKFNLGDILEFNNKSVEIIDRFTFHEEPVYVIFIEAFNMKEISESELMAYKLLKHNDDSDRKQFIEKIKKASKNFSKYKFNINDNVFFCEETYVISDRYNIPSYLDNGIVYVPIYVLTGKNKKSLYIEEDDIRLSTAKE